MVELPVPKLILGFNQLWLLSIVQYTLELMSNDFVLLAGAAIVRLFAATLSNGATQPHSFHKYLYQLSLNVKSLSGQILVRHYRLQAMH